MKLLNNKGYTLVEILSVVVIFSVVLAVAYPAIHKITASNELDTFARRVVRDIRFAQHEAVYKNMDVKVKFDTGAGDYILEYVSGGQIGSSVSLPAKVRYVSASFKSGVPHVVFKKNGTPDLTNEGMVILMDTNGSTIRVIVNPSGNVRMQ